MKRQLKQVREFNEAFGLEVNDTPTVGEWDQIELRFDLIKEENEEYYEASTFNNKEKQLVETFDAILDLMYLVNGLAVYHGFSPEQMEAGFDEVQRSNMSKLGKDGKPIYREDGKVLKGENYFKPDLKKILFG